MSTDRPPEGGGAAWLERLATDIADAVLVDWTRTPPADIEVSVESLATIARIAEGYRRVGAPQRTPAFRWGPLEVYERVGEGSFGEVYRAWDPRLAIDVALKLRHPSTHDAPARQLLDEARGLARISHPCVVTVRGADVHDGRFGLWVDFVDGPSLDALLARDGRLPVDEVSHIGEALARATHAVHDAGFLHGDVTARNVLLAPGNQPILVDFGAASPIDADGVATGELAGLTGTPVAVAPEVFFGSRPSVRSDVYAIGALLFRLLTGRHAVEGDSIDEIRDALRRGRTVELRALRDDVPGPLVEVVRRAISGRPEDRQSSAAELADALRTATTPATNVPRARTRIIGRDSELATIAEQVEGGRVVTLVGVGGVGKTRLALAVAEHVLPDHPDGVWFVDLARCAPERVAAALAEVLGPPRSKDASTVERVIGHLENQRSLVILDNCEHAAEAVATLLDAALARVSKVAFMATSRERLGVDGERVVEVSPLEVPVPGVPARLEDVPSTALFIERARHRCSDFSLDGDAADAIAEICRRLDGLPLAVELAAAQVGTMSVTDLAARMDGQLDLLVRRRGGDRRHRTLRDLLDWSYLTLDGPERALFASLAMFRAGWTLDHAAALREDMSGPTCLRAHAGLVERSLVVVVASDAETRYRFLEPVREYALEKLGDDDEVRGRFVETMRRIVVSPAKSAPEVSTDDHRRIVAEDMPNAVAAAAVALRRGDADGAAEITSALDGAWRMRGEYAQAIRWYETLHAQRAGIRSADLRAETWLNAAAALNDTGRHEDAERFARAASDEVEHGAAPIVGVRALNQRGTASMGLGRFDECEARWHEALASCEAFDEIDAEVARCRAVSMSNLAIMKRWRGDLEGARALFESALTLYERHDMPLYAAFALLNVAETRFDADDAEGAWPTALEATRRIRVLGAPYNLTIALTLLARIGLFQGMLETAEAYAVEARSLARAAALDQKYVLYVLAAIAAARGDHALARDLALDALRGAHHKPGDVRSAFVHLGPALGRLGDHRSCVWMMACATAHGNEATGPLKPVARLTAAHAERALDAARAAMSDAEFERAWSRGAAMGFEAAARAALGR